MSQDRPRGKVPAAEMRRRVENVELTLGVNLGIVHADLKKTLGPSRFEAEAAIAREVLADLEDRRVLFHPQGMEIEDQCIASVLDMRRVLTEKIGKLEQNSTLAGLLRQIRAACRRFLDETNGGAAPRYRPFHPWDDEPGFWAALWELRSLTGVCVAQIAGRYDLEVEPELSVILPPVPADGDQKTSVRRSTQAAIAVARTRSSVAISSSTSPDAKMPSGPRGVMSVKGDS